MPDQPAAAASEQNESTTNWFKKNKKLIGMVGIGLIVFICLYWGYYAYEKNNSTTSLQSGTPDKLASSSTNLANTASSQSGTPDKLASSSNNLVNASPQVEQSALISNMSENDANSIKN
ncbi:hypothetical protein GINT2_002098 [Glugoides intestinalis]